MFRHGLGISEVSFIPTRKHVLLKGTASNSALGFVNKTYDEGVQFKLTIAGVGNEVESFKIGDHILNYQPLSKRIEVSDNQNSFESITNYMKKLKSTELEKFIGDTAIDGKIEFTEYFVIQDYDICGIIID